MAITNRKHSNKQKKKEHPESKIEKKLTNNKIMELQKTKKTNRNYI
jgi:hypothetical protein